MIEFSQFLFERLVGDPALNTALGGRFIYELLAPQGKACPYVLFNLQAGSDGMGLGSFRNYTSEVWQVRAVTQDGNMNAAAAIAALVDARLSGSGADVGSAYTVRVMWRQRPLQFVEVFEGVRYYHCGGLYRLEGRSL